MYAEREKKVQEGVFVSKRVKELQELNNGTPILSSNGRTINRRGMINSA
jgi:hypothetical protein